MDEDDGLKPKAAEVPPETVLINELIREYLEYNGWKHTLAVMVPEAGHVANKLPRNTLAHELNLSEHDKTPLLYQLIHHAKHSLAEHEGGVSASQGHAGGALLPEAPPVSGGRTSGS